jgi:hypothetical protein
LAVAEGSHALIGWGACEEGETCNIVTVTGDAENGQCWIAGNRGRLQDARSKDGNNYCPAGWKQLLKDNGYEITPKVLAKKVLP